MKSGARRTANGGVCLLRPYSIPNLTDQRKQGMAEKNKVSESLLMLRNRLQALVRSKRTLGRQGPAESGTNGARLALM